MPVTGLARVLTDATELVEIAPLLYVSIIRISLYVVAPSKFDNIIEFCILMPVYLFDLLPDAISILLILLVGGDAGKV